MHVFNVEVLLSFPLQNGLPAFSNPRIIEQSFRDAAESNISAKRKVAEGNERILEWKEDFNQLLVQVSSLKKDLHHLMHQHIVPIQSSLPNASSAGICCCYSKNDFYPRFVLINDQPVLNLQLMSRCSFHYRLYDSPSTSSSLSARAWIEGKLFVRATLPNALNVINASSVCKLVQLVTASRLTLNHEGRVNPMKDECHYQIKH